MKRNIVSFVLITAGLVLVPAAYADKPENNSLRQNINNQIKEERQIIRDTRKTEMKNLFQEIRDNIASRVGELKNRVSRRAFLHQVKITAIGTNNLTVERDSKSYSVNVDANTRIRRRYYGNAVFSDLLVGHLVDVAGKWTDDTKTTILANLIRDISIQKRHGVFIGVVQVIAGNDITIKTVNRGTQKATVNSSTVFVNRMQQKISLSDIAVGHRIRVKGMWDSSLNTITEVTQVKDFSLPVRPAVTPKTENDENEGDEEHPKVTPTITPTVSPTATPTPAPTATPTPVPTVTPTAIPTPTPTQPAV